MTVSADGELQGYNGGLLSGGEAFNQSGKNYISFSVSDGARSVIFSDEVTLKYELDRGYSRFMAGSCK